MIVTLTIYPCGSSFTPSFVYKQKQVGIVTPRPSTTRWVFLLRYFAHAGFGQVQFVCANLPGYHLRRIRDHRCQILPYPTGLEEFVLVFTWLYNRIHNSTQSSVVHFELFRRSGLGTSKSIYVGGTLLSILISLYLFLSGRRETGIFVGLWAPTVLNLGQTLLEDDPAQQPTWRERLLRSK